MTKINYQYNLLQPISIWKQKSFMKCTCIFETENTVAEAFLEWKHFILHCGFKMLFWD